MQFHIVRYSNNQTVHQGPLLYKEQSQQRKKNEIAPKTANKTTHKHTTHTPLHSATCSLSVHARRQTPTDRCTKRAMTVCLLWPAV